MLSPPKSWAPRALLSPEFRFWRWRPRLRREPSTGSRIRLTPGTLRAGHELKVMAHLEISSTLPTDSTALRQPGILLLSGNAGPLSGGSITPCRTQPVLMETTISFRSAKYRRSAQTALAGKYIGMGGATRTFTPANGSRSYGISWRQNGADWVSAILTLSVLQRDTPRGSPN